MANAKKCDRCGCYYDQNDFMTFNNSGTHVDRVATVLNNGVVYKPYDLCDECLNKFIDFMCGCEVKKEKNNLWLMLFLFQKKCNLF